MKKFMDPELEIIKYGVEDIITTSYDEEEKPDDVENGVGWF